MINNCELLFQNDINRSQKYSNRTREEIITDRWIVYKQDDPSFDSVMQWFKSENISLYSSYPPTNQFLVDSHLNFPKKKLYDLKGTNSINELLWMRKNQSDFEVLNKFTKINKNFIKTQNTLSNIMSDIRLDSLPNKNKIGNSLKNYLKSLDQIQTLEKTEIESTKLFLKEINDLLFYVNKKSKNEVLKTINKSKYLFKGNAGVRHVDYIGIKD